MAQTEEFELKTLKSVWVSSPYPMVTLGLEKMLGAKVRVYVGQEPPADELPSSVILCTNGEDVVSEVRRLQALAPDAHILVLGLRVGPRLARTALLAGAHGFIHLGMQPVQIVRALSVVSKDKAILPRELLEAFLLEMESRVDLIILTPRQREVLELLAAAATSGGEVMIPRGLLEAFLTEVAIDTAVPNSGSSTAPGGREGPTTRDRRPVRVGGRPRSCRVSDR